MFDVVRLIQGTSRQGATSQVQFLGEISIIFYFARNVSAYRNRSRVLQIPVDNLSAIRIYYELPIFQF